MKVRITNKVSTFAVGTKTYRPGDIVEVPEQFISPSFMELVDQPKPAEKVEAVVKTTLPEPSVDSVEEPQRVVEEPKPPKVRRRKKSTS